jgi:ribose transport system permease protein
MENINGKNEVFCISCGTIIRKEAVICPKCGVKQMAVNTQIYSNIQIGQFIRIGVLFVLLFFGVIVASVTSVTSGVFLNPSNIRNIMYQYIPLLMTGVVTFLVMNSGGIDFSIGSLIGLTSVILGIFNGSILGATMALFVGLIFGCINGLIAIKTPVKSFIVTIATMTLIRGIALAISDGQPKQIQVNSTYFSIQLLLVMLVVGVSFFLLFKKYGMVDKGNINFSSLKRDNISILYYLLSAFSAVIVGIFLSFRIRVGIPTAGSGYEVDAIIVAILGGVACGYAAINLVSTIIAALLLAVMVNFFNLNGINVYMQIILKIVVLFIGFIPLFVKGAMVPEEKKAIIADTTNKPKYCSRCGAEVGADDTICMKCGCKF